MGLRDRSVGAALLGGLLPALGLRLLYVRGGRSVQHPPQHVIGPDGFRVHGHGSVRRG